MPIDLAIDWNTGDLLVAPNKDVALRDGQSLVDQRIRVRLKIPRDEWLLDPTGGQLGSHLRDALRTPVWRATSEVPLIVNEALEPMIDIDVQETQVFPDEDDSAAVGLVVYYTILDDEGADTGDVLSTSIDVS